MRVHIYFKDNELPKRFFPAKFEQEDGVVKLYFNDSIEEYSLSDIKKITINSNIWSGR